MLIVLMEWMTDWKNLECDSVDPMKRRQWTADNLGQCQNLDLSVNNKKRNSEGLLIVNKLL